MGKRRGRRTRSDDGKHLSAGDGWTLRNSPLTPEGQIEGASRFGRSGGSPRRRRLLRRMGLLLIVAPVVIFLIAVVVTLLSR
jgi:hypothetical protein